jgi:hypothetical protein
VLLGRTTAAARTALLAERVVQRHLSV